MAENIEITVDLGPGDDMAMGEDVMERLKSNATRRRGRGLQRDTRDADAMDVGETFETFAGDDAGNAVRSVEGYIIFVTGVHEEASEDDVRNKFADFGEIRALHLNLDRRTGFVKGYAMIEYESLAEAEAAIREADGTDLLGQKLSCAWAFSKPTRGGPRRR